MKGMKHEINSKEKEIAEVCLYSLSQAWRVLL